MDVQNGGVIAKAVTDLVNVGNDEPRDTGARKPRGLQATYPYEGLVQVRVHVQFQSFSDEL